MHGTDNLSEKEKKIRGELQLEERRFFHWGWRNEVNGFSGSEQAHLPSSSTHRVSCTRPLAHRWIRLACALWNSVWEYFESLEINPVSWEKAQTGVGLRKSSDWVGVGRGSVRSSWREVLGGHLGKRRLLARKMNLVFVQGLSIQLIDKRLFRVLTKLKTKKQEIHKCKRIQKI